MKIKKKNYSIFNLIFQKKKKMMNSEISSKRNSSDYVSNYSESSVNQNDNLHIEKIKVNSEEESSNNNKSKIQRKISISN